MPSPTWRVEIARGDRERIRVFENDKGQIELRVMSLIGVSAGVWSSTAEGVHFPMDILPAVITALQAATDVMKPAPRQEQASQHRGRRP